MRIRRISVVGLMLVCCMTLATAGKFPSGTHVTVRIDKTLSSGKAYKGEVWHGVLTRDVVVRHRRIARAGDRVRGKVTYVKHSGRLHSPGQITIRLISIKGVRVYSSRIARKGKSHTKSNAAKIGGGTAAGALIGGLVGGGKGAVIGAAAGAGAGTAGAAATGKREAVIAAESVFTFRLSGSR